MFTTIFSTALHPAVLSPRAPLPVVRCVRFSPDGASLAAACGSRLYVWEVQSGDLLGVYREHENPAEIGDLAWSPDGKRIASLDDVLELHVSDLAGHLVAYAHCEPWATTVAWAEGKTPLVRGMKWGTLGTPVHPLARSQAWSPDGSLVAVAYQDAVLVCDASVPVVKHLYAGHRQLMMRPLVLPQDETEEEGYTPAEGRGYELWSPHQVQAVARSPRHGLLASADSAGMIHVWEERSGNLILRYGGHLAATIGALAWSPDSHFIGSAADREIKVWEAVSGRVVACEEMPTILSALDWSPDGTCLAIGDERGNVRVCQCLP